MIAAHSDWYWFGIRGITKAVSVRVWAFTHEVLSLEPKFSTKAEQTASDYTDISMPI